MYVATIHIASIPSLLSILMVEFFSFLGFTFHRQAELEQSEARIT